ncbi:MAG: energy transducer TonB [Thermodesulfobacteriota bacterium]
MKASLAVSLLFHLALGLTLQKAFPIPWAEGLRSYQVELIRPPVQGLDMDETTKADIGTVKEDRPPPPAEITQETISLDTQDRRYVSYARAVKERIMLQWKYPPEARRNLIEGKLSLVFSLSRSGQMDRITILNSSGFPILDEEAVRAVRASAPYPAFPDHIAVGRLNIEANFDYRIAARR